MTSQALVNEYKAKLSTLNEREMAEYELKIFKAAKREGKTEGIDPNNALAKLLGGSQYGYRHRRELLLEGQDADLLWERIIKGELPVLSATRILHGAKNLVIAEGISLADAVKRRLTEDYDEALNVHKRTLPNGKVIKVRNPTRMPAIGESKVQEQDGSFWDTVRDTLATVRDAAVAYTKDRLDSRSIPEVDIIKYCGRFEADIKTAIEDFQRALDRASRKLRHDDVVTRHQVVDACQMLVMDPPSPGKPIDMALAKQQKRRLVRAYHPDVQVTEVMRESLRPQFEGVLASFNVLEKYNDQVKESGR